MRLVIRRGGGKIGKAVNSSSCSIKYVCLIPPLTTKCKNQALSYFNINYIKRFCSLSGLRREKIQIQTKTVEINSRIFFSFSQNVSFSSLVGGCGAFKVEASQQLRSEFTLHFIIVAFGKIGRTGQNFTIHIWPAILYATILFLSNFYRKKNV